MRIAIQTLGAIEQAFAKDQGATFRKHLGEQLPLCGDAYSTNTDLFRKHLGASLIGRECARELWYSFHWCTEKKFDGRMLRLFNRGHLEEGRFVAMFLMIGCQVWQTDENGKQFRISGHKGHYGGSLDAVIKGIPDLPDEPVLGEFKTHGDKSFTKLVEEGVLSAKWEHFIQMQQYMGKNNLNWAIYGAVNKNTDALHLELVQFDQGQYQKYLDRSVMIIDAVTPPPKINNSPGYFKCKFCNHSPVCHTKALPARNCRTCRHSVVADEGAWICANWETICEAEAQGWEDPIELDFKTQLSGCERYEMNPKIKE